jgi:hypothetical protein
LRKYRLADSLIGRCLRKVTAPTIFARPLVQAAIRHHSTRAANQFILKF